MPRVMKAPPTGGLLRALLLSLAAAAVPIAGVFLFPEGLQDYEALTWLLLLVPAFLWSYERGWRGIATALALAMAALTTTYAIVLYRGSTLPDLLLAVVTLYVAITLAIGLFRDRVARSQVEQVTESLALQDAVTGLPNRRHAEMHIEMEFAAAQRGRSVTVVVFDMDRMDEYNARNGRAAGDGVLRGFATLLRQVTRRMDLAARIDDDAFVSVLAGCPEDGAVVFAGRMQERLRAAESTVALPTVSAGIAAFSADMAGPADLLRAAELALRQAKRDGRDRVRVYDRTLDQQDSAGAGVSERPAAADAAPLPGAPWQEAARGTPPAPLGAGRSAFVQTQDEDLRVRLVAFLRREQFRVTAGSASGDGVLPLHEEFDIVFLDIGADRLAVAGLVRELRQRSPTTRVIGMPRLQSDTVPPELLHVRVDAHHVPSWDETSLRQQMAELLAERDVLLSAQLRSRQLAHELRAKDRETQLALEASEARYRLIVQSIQEVIFTTDDEGTLVSLNPAWTSMTGFNVEESVGTSLFEFVHPHEAEALRAGFGELVRHHAPFYWHDCRWRTRDGAYRLVELRLQLTAATGGVTGVLADVTKRRSEDDTLRPVAEPGRSRVVLSEDEADSERAAVAHGAREADGGAAERPTPAELEVQPQVEREI